MSGTKVKSLAGHNKKNNRSQEYNEILKRQREFDKEPLKDLIYFVYRKFNASEADIAEATNRTPSWVNQHFPRRDA
jgi:inorganic pyrophosphatase/exopolyphosphatase